MIIDKGIKVIDKPIEYLDVLQADKRVVFVQFDRKILTNSLKKSISGISRVEEVDDSGAYRVYSSPDLDLRKSIFQYAVEKGAAIIEMTQQKSSVEDVFQHLTKSES